MGVEQDILAVQTSRLDVETKIARIVAIQNKLYDAQRSRTTAQLQQLRDAAKEVDKALKDAGAGASSGASASSAYSGATSSVGSSASSASSNLTTFSGAVQTALSKTSLATQKLSEYRQTLEDLAQPHVVMVDRLRELAGGSLAVYRAQERLGDSAGIKEYYERLGETTEFAGKMNDAQAKLFMRINEGNKVFSFASAQVEDLTLKMSGMKDGSSGAFDPKFMAQGMSLVEIMGSATATLEGYVDVLNDARLGATFAADQAALGAQRWQEELARADFAMKAYNVSSSEITDIVTYNFNATGKATTELFSDMIKSAEAADLAYGISADEIVKDTIKMMQNVQTFGFRTPDEFARISKAARDAHMTISDLQSVMGKFDTFETAAQTVGDLNAQLGTNFDALRLMELRYTDTEKFIEELGKGFRQTGKSFDEMFGGDKLPFLTFATGQLSMTADQLRAAFTGDVDAGKIAAELDAAKKEITATGTSADELMKSRIPAMKSVVESQDDMVKRLEQQAQLLAGASRAVVKASQDANTELLRLSNTLNTEVAPAQAGAITKLVGTYKGLIKTAVSELETIISGQAQKIIQDIKAVGDAIAAQIGRMSGPAATVMAGAAGTTDAETRGAGATASSTPVRDMIMPPGGAVTVSRTFGGLFEKYMLDTRDAVMAGPPDVIESLLAQSKLLRSLVTTLSEQTESPSVVSLSEPLQIPSPTIIYPQAGVTKAEPPRAPDETRAPLAARGPAAPRLAEALQGALQGAGSTINISIDKAAFTRFVVESIVSEYPDLLRG